MSPRIELLGVPDSGKSKPVPEATDEPQRAGMATGGMSDAVHPYDHI